MRIVAGRFRGRRIELPRGVDARPTSDRAREALFSILGEEVAGASVIDLFAGSGALGIEALSRGAASVLFVEAERKIAEALVANLARIGAAESEARVVRGDALAEAARLAAAGRRFDLVLADPPWSAIAPDAVARAVSPLLSDRGVAVVEHDAKNAPPEGEWEVRRYGSVAFALHPPRSRTRR